MKVAKRVAYSPADRVPPPFCSFPLTFKVLPRAFNLALGVSIGSAARIHNVVEAKLQIFAQQLLTLSMLQDLQVALALLTKLFVQRPSYFMRTVVPAPDFLAQRGRFDAHIFADIRAELIEPSSF